MKYACACVLSPDEIWQLSVNKHEESRWEDYWSVVPCCVSVVWFVLPCSMWVSTSELYVIDQCWNVDRARAGEVVSIQLHVGAVLPQPGAGGLWAGWVTQRPDAVWHDSLLRHVQRQRHRKRPAPQCWSLPIVISGQCQHECSMGTMQKVNLVPVILH